MVTAIVTVGVVRFWSLSGLPPRHVLRCWEIVWNVSIYRIIELSIYIISSALGPSIPWRTLVLCADIDLPCVKYRGHIDYHSFFSLSVRIVSLNLCAVFKLFRLFFVAEMNPFSTALPYVGTKHSNMQNGTGVLKGLRAGAFEADVISW